MRRTFKRVLTLNETLELLEMSCADYRDRLAEELLDDLIDIARCDNAAAAETWLKEVKKRV